MNVLQAKTKTDNIPVVYSLPQLATVCGLPLYTIRRWVKEGKFPVVNSGRKIFVNLETFNKFLINGDSATANNGIRKIKG